MIDYPPGNCKNKELHLPHIHADRGPLQSCQGQGERQEYVYRLVNEDTGLSVGTWNKQYVYHNLGVARGQCTKYNGKSWNRGKAVVQRGLIQWSTDPV